MTATGGHPEDYAPREQETWEAGHEARREGGIDHWGLRRHGPGLRSAICERGRNRFIAGRNEERGDALAAEINEAGGKAHFVELDVTNQGHRDADIAEVKERA